MSNHRADVLDVEDDEQRQNRIGALLGRLSNSTTSTMVNPDPILIIGHERPPGPIEPPTDLLARVQAFLPAISAANKRLSQMIPEEIDIEKVTENDEQYIEMNLGLGVLEAKPHNSGSRSASPSSEVDPSSDAISSESESDSELSRANSEGDSESVYFSSSSEYDSDAGSLSGSSADMKPIFSRLIRPLPRRVSQQNKTDV